MNPRPTLWLTLACIVISFAITGCEPDVAPVADFSAAVRSGDAPLAVLFEDRTVAGSSAITSYAWDFGDGFSSTDSNPNHVFGIPGSYTVSLTVTTAVGTDTATFTDYNIVVSAGAGVVVGDNTNVVDFQAELGVS